MNFQDTFRHPGKKILRTTPEHKITDAIDKAKSLGFVEGKILERKADKSNFPKKVKIIGHNIKNYGPIRGNQSELVCLPIDNEGKVIGQEIFISTQDYSLE